MPNNLVESSVMHDRDSSNPELSEWSKNSCRHDSARVDFPHQNEGTSHTTLSPSSKSEVLVCCVLPKVRPFDAICLPSKTKPKKPTNATNYLQAGKMLEYLDSLMESLSSMQKSSLVVSHHHHSQSHDSNSFTAIDTLTYSEVVRHLTTLRTEHVQRFIRPVLQRLLLHPRNVGNLFNKPVDPVAQELPDYFLRIKRPMDLGTVKSRLQRGYYRNIESVTADIQLVFKNAILYNAANHAIHLIAKTMKGDFETDLTALEERCSREMDRKSTHSCTLCQGSSCPLCGEKCLKFDPPVLVCHGTCMQRVKRNSVYYVTADGIMLWCLRCYTGLPPVILELLGRPPLLKKNLLKRRLDEEVAEPWVSCDICGHWFHHICALYNDRIGAAGRRGGLAISGASSTYTAPRGPYECPLCKLESMQQLCVKMSLSEKPKDKMQTQGQVQGQKEGKCVVRANHIIDQSKGTDGAIDGSTCDIDTTTSDSEMGDGDKVALSKIGVSTIVRAHVRAVSVPPARAETRSRSTATAAPVAPVVIPRAPSVTTGAATLVSAKKVLKKTRRGRGSSLVIDAIIPCPSFVSSAEAAVMETEGGKGSEDMMDVSEGSSIHTNNTVAVTDIHYDRSLLPGGILRGDGVHVDKKRRSRDGLNGDVDLILSIDSNQNPNAALGVASGVQMNEESNPESLPTPTPTSSPLPAHLNQWRASTLPRSALSDFLEAVVMEKLRDSGFEDAASTVTVRLTSNVEQYMELPVTITDNLRAPEGTVLSPYIPYRQKCILLFQNVDGVDICLFCLYVQEFDEKCPAPNTSVVYIAYLDSVDFFRPMEARTLVYQEIMVGYFKWAQMRGFKYGHIWSCPPQRGDNFIFWCHPPHQRTPSRDRLNAWYNSILLRSSKLGILEEVDTLWSAYFSGYGRRESSGRKEKDKEREKEDLRVSSPNLSGAESFDDVIIAAAASAVTYVGAATAIPPHSSGSSSSGRHSKADGTSAGGEPEDAPVCPPVFEGDFWVTECMRVHRLVMGRSKGCDGQDRGVNQRKCRDLLKDLMSKPSSIPFCRPVDIVKLGIPDYPIVIPKPMDLGTIRDLLRARYYKSILHFAEDVRLTFNNALRYNPAGHPIHITARALSVEFHQSLVDLLSEYIGAVPKAENVDKYLDSYPIADTVALHTAPENADSVSVENQSNVLPVPIPIPAKAANSVSDERHKDRSRRKSAAISGKSNGVSDGNGAAVSCQTPVSVAEGDHDHDEYAEEDRHMDMTSPRICRADSTDSVFSTFSHLNDGDTPDPSDGWIPRLPFTSSALSGPVPANLSGTPGVSAGPNKAFEKPTLGFKGAMALMSEIAKSVFRLKDDLFVIKFADPTKRVHSRMPKTKKMCVDVDGHTEMEDERERGDDMDTDIDRDRCRERERDEDSHKDNMMGDVSASSLLFQGVGDTDEAKHQHQNHHHTVHFPLTLETKDRESFFESESVTMAEEGAHGTEVAVGDDMEEDSTVSEEHEGDEFKGGVYHMAVQGPSSDESRALHAGEVFCNADEDADVGVDTVVDGEGAIVGAAEQSTSPSSTFEWQIKKEFKEVGEGEGDYGVEISLQRDETLSTTDMHATDQDRYDSVDPLLTCREILDDDACHLAVAMDFPSTSATATNGTNGNRRKGRSTVRKRSSHQRKSMSPKGRKIKSQASHVETYAPVESTAAYVTPCPGDTLNKAKGGKAGAYLRRMSGDRTLSGETEDVQCEHFSQRCLDLLTKVVPDTSDPDPLIRCAFVDSRHTFLEMCQFRHYQFDSLRRAKHSSLMLLYHLHFPDNLDARPTCALCGGAIREVRWHCDQCADFDVCDTCYKAGEAQTDVGENHAAAAALPLGSSKLKQKGRESPMPCTALPVPPRVEKHFHPLTPFRITYI